MACRLNAVRYQQDGLSFPVDGLKQIHHTCRRSGIQCPGRFIRKLYPYPFMP